MTTETPYREENIKTTAVGPGLDGKIPRFLSTIPRSTESRENANRRRDWQTPLLRPSPVALPSIVRDHRRFLFTITPLNTNPSPKSDFAALLPTEDAYGSFPVRRARRRLRAMRRSGGDDGGDGERKKTNNAYRK